jgi:hypothetical protein
VTVADEMVWMRHREHGGVNEFPVAAVEAWESLGWEPCDDPPPAPDPAMVEHQPRPAPAPPADEEAAPEAEAQAEPAAKPSKKTTTDTEGVASDA